MRISGDACREGAGNVRFYVYKGENQYNQPLWQITNCGKFNITVKYAEKEQIFFGVAAEGDDSYARTRWKLLELETSPTKSDDIINIGSNDKKLEAIGNVSLTQIVTLTAISTPAIQSTPPSSTPIITLPTVSLQEIQSTPPFSLPSDSSFSNNGNFKQTLPIIVIIIFFLLVGCGGYGIYRMKRKPVGEQLTVLAVKEPGKEQSLPTALSSGAGNLILTNNMLNRITLVERKISVLQHFSSPVQVLIAKAREQYRSGAYDAVQTTLITAEDAITSLALYETRLKQWKKEGYTTTSLESLKTDNITTINTAFHNFEQDISTLKQHEHHIQELKRSCSTGNVDPLISQCIASIESQLHDPHNILSIEQEIDATEQQILRDQQERAKQQQDTEQLFTRLHMKAEKLIRYAPLTTGSFTEAQDQITAGRYDDAQKTLLRVEDPINALLECESLLAAWKAKGYTIPELEGVHPLDADEVLLIFQKSQQNINRLEAIKLDLESKKRFYPNFFEHLETASIVISIEQNLKNPTLIDTVEKDYQQLIYVLRQREEKQKIIEQNLRSQVEKVQREAGSPVINQKTASIMKSIPVSYTHLTLPTKRIV